MTHAELPTLQYALDPALYREEAVFEAERAQIFKRNWRLAGHSSMLSKPGDYLCEEIAGQSVLIIRGDDDVLRAFYNICRHRAGPLVDAPSGNCGHELRCHYHGWRYALDGRLRSARDFGRAKGFDPRDFGLYPARLEIWHGFLFICLCDDAPSLEARMAPVAKGLAEAPMQPFAFTRTHHLACNWKTYVENYLEGYHVPDVHPGLNEEIEAHNYRVIMDGEVAVHQAPSKHADTVYTGYWAWVWPLLGVNVYQHGLMMERITPVSVRETRLDYLYFFDPARREELDEMIALSDDVTREDKIICERVQQNLDSGVYSPGPLSPRHENAIAWFHARLRAEMNWQ